MSNIIDRAGQYYRDVITEMRKVVWPTREEVKDQTVVVLAVSGVLALFTFMVDWAIGYLMGKVL